MDPLLPICARRKQCTHISGRHESRDGLNGLFAPSLPDRGNGNELPLALIPRHRWGIGNGKEPAVIGKRDKLHLFRQNCLVTAHSCHGQSRVIVDIPLGIGIKQFGKFFPSPLLIFFHGTPVSWLPGGEICITSYTFRE